MRKAHKTDGAVYRNYGTFKICKNAYSINLRSTTIKSTEFLKFRVITSFDRKKFSVPQNHYRSFLVHSSWVTCNSLN